MTDPNLFTPADSDYYKIVPGVLTDYSKRTHEQLVNDVNVLHDFTKRLVHEKDELWQTLRNVRAELQRERNWRRGLTTALGFTLVTVGGVLKFLIPYAIRGMLVAK